MSFLTFLGFGLIIFGAFFAGFVVGIKTGFEMVNIK